MLDQKTFRVVGVMPAAFNLGTEKHGIWEALTSDAKERSRVAGAIVRLKSDITLAQANAQLKAVSPRLSSAFTGAAAGSVLAASQLKLQMVAGAKKELFILLGAVGFVLLIACVNISSLLLARSWTRQREIAIRVALGATRSRIIRQFLAETVTLALAGGALGFLFAIWGVKALRGIAPPDTPHLDQLKIDMHVLLFTLAISLLAGILFGLAPALQTSVRCIGETIKGSLGGLSKGSALRGSRRLGSPLVVCEIALAAVLVTGAALVTRSFAKLITVNLGFRTDHILTMNVNFSKSTCDMTEPQRFAQSPEPNLAKCYAAVRDVLTRVQNLAGVQSAAAGGLPLTAGARSISLQFEGQKSEIGIAQGQLFGFRTVSPDYFATIGIPLLTGRAFTADDRRGSPLVAIVNEAFAREDFSSSPIGRRFSTHKDKNGRPQWIEIVGEVKNSRDLELKEKPTPEYYLPLSQADYLWDSDFLVRTAFNPDAISAAVQQQIWSVDKDAPITNVRTMDQVVSATVAEPRFRMLLLGSFGFLGLVIALVGVYGVISYAVSQRIHEIGIRMALGAQPSNLLRMVISEGMRLAVAGIAAGVVGALCLGRVLQSMLFELKPTDPTTLVGASVALALAALAACYIPARRASRVDPMIALRHE
jgi:putative ABC transport system permease protein